MIAIFTFIYSFKHHANGSNNLYYHKTLSHNNNALLSHSHLMTS